MPTKKEYDDALKVIASYAESKTQEAKVRTDVGARVKLSSWGLEMQGNKKKLRGTVVGYNQWMEFVGDGTATVLWDGQRKTNDMHISQIEII